MKKFIAFLLAVGMVTLLVPTQDADARGGRGGRRSGGISGAGARSSRAGNRDKNAQKLQERRKLEDEDSLLRDRTRERRDRTS